MKRDIPRNEALAQPLLPKGSRDGGENATQSNTEILAALAELGRFGRNRTNIWPYPSMSSFGKDREAALAGRPTTKPLALVSDVILDCSKRGGVVLDAFAGSGTTLLAAEKTGRRGYGIELDPHYADVVTQRFDDPHGTKATHADLKSSFDQQSERTQSRISEEIGK